MSMSGVTLPASMSFLRTSKFSARSLPTSGRSFWSTKSESGGARTTWRSKAPSRLRTPMPKRRTKEGWPVMRRHTPASTPVACTRTSTSPSPALGVSRSLGARASGEPYASWRIAFTASLPQSTTMTMLPLFCSVSAYRWASAICSRG